MIPSRSFADAHHEGVGGIEDQRSFGVDVGRAPDPGIDPSFADLDRAFKQASHDALLPPGFPFAELALGDQAGELGARAGPARRTIVCLPGAEDEAPAVGRRVHGWAEQFDMVDLATVVAREALI